MATGNVVALLFISHQAHAAFQLLNMIVNGTGAEEHKPARIAGITVVVSCGAVGNQGVFITVYEHDRDYRLRCNEVQVHDRASPGDDPGITEQGVKGLPVKIHYTTLPEGCVQCGFGAGTAPGNKHLSGIDAKRVGPV